MVDLRTNHPRRYFKPSDFGPFLAMIPPPSPVTFSPVSSRDYPRIREMALRIWSEAYREIISEEQMHYMIERMYSSKVIANEVKSDGIRYQWILEASEPVGYLAFGPVEPRKPCTLQKLYLLPNRHGKGIGSATLKWLFQTLREASVPDLNLRVNRQNEAAIRCYERNGFQTIAEDCLDIGHGYVMDDFIMRLSLNP